MRKAFDSATRSWMLYDWASSAFATTVMAGFFPIFFKEFWCAGVDVTQSSFRLGTTSSLASLIVALMAPLLGATADASGTRKRFLLSFAALGVAMTGGLALIAQGQWLWAAAVYVAAVIGFSGANVFYDSLLVSVATPDQRDRVSATGFAVGYLGGGLLFAINVLMTLFPSRFGLADASAAVRMSFVTVAVWWAVFSVPAALRIREPASAGATGTTVLDGLRQVVDTIRHLRKHRATAIFLLAYWLYIDRVHTIVRMAVDYGLALGFSSTHLIAALLLVQFVAFPSSLAFGHFAGKVGARRAIFVGLAVYLGISLWGYRLQHVWEFYALASAIGLVQGGVTSLSRSYFSRLIPADQSAQFFGFYNTVGRFSAVLGPVLMGWVSYATGNPRFSMFAITALFLAGGAILRKVPEVDADNPR